MVYLIDDKRRRQENDFGWNEKKFQQYKDVLIPIYGIEELLEKAEDIFKSNNSVLYHESFLDNSIYSSEALEKRKRLEEFAANNKEFNLVLFSGSKFNRSLSDNTAHLPVSILYLNLEMYLFQAQEGRKDLNFLLFGKNPKVESELNEKLKKALSEIESSPADIPNQNSLFLRTVKDNIQNPIENCVEKTLFNKDVSDAKFSEYIDSWLDDVKYDNIFVPLCFGPTLSDFNGLRFATHIRCSDTINRASNVFIYGFVGIGDILDQECFNILKTKNVKLIGFQKSQFQKVGNEHKEKLSDDDLPIEIKKLQLNIPKDFEDNHSINNEWALYKWIWALPSTFYDKTEKVLNNVENRLYFKYLKTIYPVGYDTVHEEELNLKSVKGRILLIDNDYEKGWKVLFDYIVNSCNGLQFDTLEIDYRASSRNKIIDCAYNKVINERTDEINYDVVILDFRLHPLDNSETDINRISGMQVLKKLKDFNPGIQVIIFSATNKIWNFQAIKEAGADGFILKEGFENSPDINFTNRSIISMIKNLDDSLEMIFLQEFYSKLKILKKELIPRKNFKKSSNPLPKEFVDEVLKWSEMTINVLITGLSEINKTSAFIMMFSVLENLSNRIIDSDNPVELSNSNKEIVYQFEFRKEQKKLKYYKEDGNGKYYNSGIILQRSNSAIPWGQKILNTLNYVNAGIMNDNDLNGLVKKRNDIIHANSTTGDQAKISKEDIIFLNSILFKGLKNVK